MEGRSEIRKAEKESMAFERDLRNAVGAEEGIQSLPGAAEVEVASQVVLEETFSVWEYLAHNS